MIDLIALVENANSLRPTTKRGYLVVVKQWLDFAGADPSNWTAATCQAFYNHLLTRVSVKTANAMITGGLTYAFDRAHALHHIPNVVAAIDRSKSPVDPDDDPAGRALTGKQAREFLAAAEGSSLSARRDHALITLGLYTGMRRMSLVSLDTNNAAVREGYVGLKVLLKGGDWYYVPLDLRGWGQLTVYRSALKELRPKDGPLFPRIRQASKASLDAPLGIITPGDRITEDGVYKTLVAKATSAGLTDFHPHMLRHTFVTWCRQAGIDADTVSMITGHKSPTGHTMIDHYTDKTGIYAGAAARCYEAVAAQLRG